MSGKETERGGIRAALAAAGDLIYEWDVVGDRIEWTGPIEEVLGIREPALIANGDRFHGRMNSEDLKNRLKLLSRHFVDDGRFDCEYRVRADGGTFVWVHERGCVERDTAGRPVRMRGILRGMTESRRTAERLEYLANHDELTGHFNRTRLKQSVDHALRSCARHRRSGVYLVVDVDHFAMVNDAFGHDVGDEVLIGLGERLARLVGASDIVGRLEGDSFGILVDESDHDGAGAVAERIIRALRDLPLTTSVGEVSVTVSIGGIVFPESARTPQNVMARAEAALNEAKRAGRNRFALYRLTDVEREMMRRNVTLAQEVQEALADNRITLAYQPIVHSASGEPAFHECLLRMNRTNGEVLTAAAFVPVVEKLGLIRQFDRCALELAVQELTADTQARLAINVSGLTVTDHAWLRSLVTLLRGKPEVARRLIVEITETSALDDIDESARFVDAVRGLGCRVALDDFGAGYSSFRHLKSLPVDMVKIDGSFVAELGERMDNILFIRTLLGLARGFGLETVAECVEREEEADMLRREGLTFMQGWLFGRPELGRPCRTGAVAARQLDAVAGGNILSGTMHGAG